MKKILVFAIFGVFLISSVVESGVSHEKTVATREYVEERPIVPFFTENGIEWSIVNEKVKPENPGKPDKPGKPGNGDDGDSGDGIVNKWALCIGIADYEGTANDLNYCDDDAMEWKGFLEGEGYSVTILLDDQATAGNIDTAIDDLLADEDGDDYVVFTYSGHGAKYRRYGSCIISHDLWGMTNGWFKSKFNSADSSHIYFAFDACEIGDFRKSVAKNRVGAFASRNQYSYETPALGNGVFTYYQIEGWSIYDTFEEDADYAVQKMQEWASQYIGLTIDPFYVDNYAGYMYP